MSGQHCENYDVKREKILTAVGRFSNFAFVLFCYITNHLMTGPLGNSEFFFPLNVSRDEVEEDIEIRGKQNSQFPLGPVIKCLLFMLKANP